MFSGIKGFNSLISLKARLLMAAITEWFVFRMAASAQCCLRSLPCGAAAAGDNREITREQQWTIGHRLDRQFAAFGLKTITGVAHGAKIFKTGFEVAVVTERFVAGLAAAAQCGAVTDTRHILRCIFDMQFSLDVERAIVANLHGITPGGLFIVTLRFVVIGQGA